MIYSFFIKKTQGDTAPFNIANLIKNFLSNNQNVFLLGWPGYISTTSQGIDDFYSEICPSNLVVSGYFFHSLNGNRAIYCSKTNNYITNEDYMNMKFGGYKCTHKRLQDHAKILALIKFYDEEINNSINGNDISDLLRNDKFDVLGLLVGSSNQSSHTYCKSPTPKGEADVFMVEENTILNKRDEFLFISSLLGNSLESINKEKNSYKNESLIISKEISNIGINSKLKDIVKDLLTNTL